jgi:hypothetical protein
MAFEKNSDTSIAPWAKPRARAAQSSFRGEFNGGSYSRKRKIP